MLMTLQATNRPELNARIDELAKVVTYSEGILNSIQLILTEAQSNLRQGNGKAELRLDVAIDSSINLVDVLGENIGNELQTCENLRWLSIDGDRLSIDQDGNITALKNGTAKVTVYNEKGIVNIYFVISSRENKNGNNNNNNNESEKVSSNKK